MQQHVALMHSVRAHTSCCEQGRMNILVGQEYPKKPVAVPRFPYTIPSRRRRLCHIYLQARQFRRSWEPGFRVQACIAVCATVLFPLMNPTLFLSGTCAKRCCRREAHNVGFFAACIAKQRLTTHLTLKDMPKSVEVRSVRSCCNFYLTSSQHT